MIRRNPGNSWGFRKSRAASVGAPSTGAGPHIRPRDSELRYCQVNRMFAFVEGDLQRCVARDLKSAETDSTRSIVRQTMCPNSILCSPRES